MNTAREIEAKAAEWLVHRDAVPDANQDEFTGWLAADPRHRAAYLRLAAAWGRTAQLRRMVPEGGEIDADLLSVRKEPWWRSGGWRPLALAAGFLVAALAGIWWDAKESAFRTYRTEIGGLSRIVLADGSTVTLNTDTELQVHFSPNKREVTLIHGEAQFNVAHDITRPFDVSAGAQMLRAVGTAFDVRLENGRPVQLIVTEGRVAVTGAKPSEDGGAAMVSAGEQAIADTLQVKVSHLSSTEVSRRLSWKTGELSFQGEALSDVIAEFNRYNRHKLRVDDPEVAKLQIGGNFQALDVGSFVAAVGRSFDLVAKEAPDGTLTLVARRSR
jgi:transmembrane sensor